MTTASASAGAAAQRARLRLRASTERGDDMIARDVPPGLPGNPRARQRWSWSKLPSDPPSRPRRRRSRRLRRRAATAVGRTITTGTPSAGAASSLARVIVAPAVLRHQRVDAVLAQAAPARRRSRYGPRDNTSWWRGGHRVFVRWGDGTDQEPRVGAGERRPSRSGPWSGRPANTAAAATMLAASTSESHHDGVAVLPAGRASTTCGNPSSSHTAAALAVIVAAKG